MPFVRYPEAVDTRVHLLEFAVRTSMTHELAARRARQPNAMDPMSWLEPRSSVIVWPAVLAAVHAVVVPSISAAAVPEDADAVATAMSPPVVHGWGTVVVVVPGATVVVVVGAVVVDVVVVAPGSVVVVVVVGVMPSAADRELHTAT
jgi:hypothetical protein